MKRFIYLLSITGTVFISAAIGIIGCEGPTGPAGIDANETCKVCHNEGSDLLAKQVQASNSQHMIGTTSERSAADCAACHTHEGFVDRMAAGTEAASADVTDPTPVNCRSCHNIHQTYTEDDWALSWIEPVELMLNGVTVDYGNGNTCANCHQPRPINPYPVSGGAEVSITSSRWGPHHGPQSSVLWGTGAYAIAGSKSYPAAGGHQHASAGCTTCHMQELEEYGNLAGDHTFHMTLVSHGAVEDAVGACTACHSGAEDFDINGAVTDMAALADSLTSLLTTKGYLTASGSINSPLTLAPDDAGVLLNLQFYNEDRSGGIHNPSYMTALLQNSIEYLNK